MKLKELLRDIPVLDTNADGEAEITGVSYDSRKTRPGDLFVAMPGYSMDGHAFIAKAAEAGAACVLCQRPPEEEIPYVRVANSRHGLALVGANWFGRPAEKMSVVAVTGTNGKTTTTYLLKAILEQARGAKVGLIGTNQNMIGQEAVPTERTTPESFEVQKLFRAMLDKGCSYVVMETSSHALYEGRVYGIPFSVGIFTNLTQDHLDFHKTMENYCDAKAILFRSCAVGVYNADDPWSKRLMKDADCRAFSYARDTDADLRAEHIELGADHISFDAVTAEERVKIKVGIPGGFMVYNTLDVLGAALQLGISLEESARVLAAVPHVKGRVEVVPTPGKDYTVLIDYAHSPDGLENVLSSVRGFAKGRTVAVFGCGGDRDRAKRPKMGRIAAQLADFVVVTSDNPRTEDPMAIIREILPGMEGTQTPYVVVENRIEAIHYAMDHARKDDVIVLCGKGHETYQVVGTEKRHLDEREVVADHLKEKQ
ncbi:UDP-N-acetylmuramoyl-L-alanyl-D-glutamate--2,6-diaminopimelate ligase [Oscillibacter sp. MSJ-2]|uniref:UDP-N-acetylmuramoyl-L-alanyl-D-glutamate--2,6-diaminopimelate ligase n=1 Tax=Dysosmobacter acutus TaxID=2841504 RepID=A0ABS6F7R7_9FIRM|nr:UDP-N-acetylmuramoyl-L-alanyl-D-glutamate--2,6-diaminopimelate ligase [Dysosmobacter acutus]MBU5626331.1 UDP-N-acetylmuramoyl-L-alanyl-D-glutamate--2,6-diaminopimelate ligase [Dysosmobacter acutus]